MQLLRPYRMEIKPYYLWLLSQQGFCFLRITVNSFQVSEENSLLFLLRNLKSKSFINLLFFEILLRISIILC